VANSEPLEDQFPSLGNPTWKAVFAQLEPLEDREEIWVQMATRHLAIYSNSTRASNLYYGAADTPGVMTLAEVEIHITFGRSLRKIDVYRHYCLPDLNHKVA